MSIFVINTCQTYPQLPTNQQALVNQLQQSGHTVYVLPWQTSLASLQKEGVIGKENAQDKVIFLPLCAWDYSAYPEQFTAWISQVLSLGGSFANAPKLMQWNMHKSYLLDLAKYADVEVIETAILPNNAADALQALVYEKAWSEVVIKPRIGQSGKGVVRWSKSVSIETIALHDSHYINGLVVQPYMQAIEQYGETSMVFFAGEYSHSVKRQPPVGEWRANSAYGVEVFAIEPSRVALSTAQGLLQQLAKHYPMPLYARVDGIDILDEGRFVINELEVIEPALYLHTYEQATERLVQKLVC